MDKKPETKKARPKRPLQKAVTVPVKSSTPVNLKSLHGIELNSETARKAIILSEIIGPPAAKRRRRK